MRRQDQGLWIGFGVLLLVLLGVPVLSGGMMASGMMRRGMMGWYGVSGDASGWMWPFGWLAMVLFWGAVVALGVMAFRLVTSGAHSAHTEPTESATEVLKRRYATGEISREQFEQMQQVMRGSA
jgi:putative membrane protein